MEDIDTVPIFLPAGLTLTDNQFPQGSVISPTATVDEKHTFESIRKNITGNRNDKEMVRIEAVDDDGEDANEEFDTHMPMHHRFKHDPNHTRQEWPNLKIKLKSGATVGKQITLILSNRYQGTQTTVEKSFKIT